MKLQLILPTSQIQVLAISSFFRSGSTRSSCFNFKSPFSQSYLAHSHKDKSFHLVELRHYFSHCTQPKPSSTIYDRRPHRAGSLTDPFHLHTVLKNKSATNLIRDPIKKRQVVSSFILKVPEPGDKGIPLIALFKRSDKVSTYRYVEII